MTKNLNPLTMLSYAGCSLLVLCASLAGASLAEMVFRCPGCTAERQALCPKLTETCAEMVREPGCGCCPVCARQEGEMCGVYTPRCASGLRCYPTPDSELPLEQLVQGQGQCRRKVDTETTTYSQEHREQTSGEAVELQPEQGVSEIPAVRKPSKETTWLGPKESAVRQHRQEMKTKMKTNKVEEVKPTRPKQCKMSLHGQRGECWCVNPHTGRPIPSAPTVRGDPNCSQYLRELDLELPEMAQI
ncbi:insulin-like growth factor-binding protein 2-A isoform X2 [Mugil cephalus]|uniref:insulin-like growth factor-binding protein 2-A isoform X2 n=1 Tax=Mugil cephalus TaxID=48193 RepID=UPI001FB67463|nr:insulin-like growth factor-binding protein 2-A isoform X2 [Mugil cephalus]